MKRIIINADDFGLNQQINHSIIKCFREGGLTSCSVLANSVYLDEAIKLSRDTLNFDGGVHLNLTCGKPLLPSSQVKTLIDKQGYFYDHFHLFWNLCQNKVNLKEVEKELNAQINKLKSFNMKISHADSHQHIHMLPQILPIVVKLLNKHHINKIRYPKEDFLFDFNKNSLFSKTWYKKIILSINCLLQKKILLKAGFKSPDFFRGTFYSENLNINKLIKIIKKTKEGVTEIMVHPKLIDGPETKALLSPDIERLIKNKKIKLLSYDKL
jgi:predicted glycoside hydrolase/deacetylase ChbG (UPF0249 family)